MISTEFAAHFGGLVFFFEIVGSFLLGVFILANFKYAIVEQLNNFAFGRINQDDLISLGLFTLLGAILLMIPGVVTDLLGGLMQFEWFALFLKNRLVKTTFPPNQNQQRDQYDYIDVEIVDEDDKPHRSDSLKR
jgi:2-isopropylmalate synthase/UPF0716 protein FxsA